MSLLAAAYVFGVLIGTLGTLVGVGGGFVIVPVVAFLAPQWRTETVTAFSLAVVFANALSGTFAYWRQRRIDLRSVPAFAGAAIPGSILGVFGANHFPRGIFDHAFGVLLLLMAAWLAFSPKRVARSVDSGTARELVDVHGNRYAWRFDMRLALAGSLVVGGVSSLFGIGGGPIQVPFLIAVLGYPEHVATATSHAVLAVTSLVATIVHVIQGDYSEDAPTVLATAFGALCGAPIGARLSRRISGAILVRILAVMLAITAIELIVGRR